MKTISIASKEIFLEIENFPFPAKLVDEQEQNEIETIFYVV